MRGRTAARLVEGAGARRGAAAVRGAEGPRAPPLSAVLKGPGRRAGRDRGPRRPRLRAHPEGLRGGEGGVPASLLGSYSRVGPARQGKHVLLDM